MTIMKMEFELEFPKVQTNTLRELTFWLDGYCPVQQCGCAREDLLTRAHVEALSEVVDLMSNALVDEKLRTMKSEKGGEDHE